jgi:hypothetical protein
MTSDRDLAGLGSTELPAPKNLKPGQRHVGAKHPNQKPSWKRKKPFLEGRDYVAQIYDDAGALLPWPPAPNKASPTFNRKAPWGYNERGIVIAPFGLTVSGLPCLTPPSGGYRSGSSNLIPGAALTPIAQSLERRLQGLGCDVIANLASLACDPKVEPRDRIKANEVLGSWLYPRQKSVELKGTTEKIQRFVIETPALPDGSSQTRSPEPMIDITPRVRSDD